jgi:hypothetical protein
VDRTGSGSLGLQWRGFGVSDSELSDFATTVLVRYYCVANHVIMKINRQFWEGVATFIFL